MNSVPSSVVPATSNLTLEIVAPDKLNPDTEFVGVIYRLVCVVDACESKSHVLVRRIARLSETLPSNSPRIFSSLGVIYLKLSRHTGIDSLQVNFVAAGNL